MKRTSDMDKLPDFYYDEESPSEYGTIVLIMVFVLFLLLCGWTNNIPIVYWSNTKNECVKVIKQGYECPCSDIDLKNDSYEKVWVK